MYFDEEFLKSLPDDWVYAVQKIADKFDIIMESNRRHIDLRYSIVQEVQLLLTVYRRKKQLKYEIPRITGTRIADIQNVIKFIEKLRADSEKNIKKQAEEKRLKHYKNVFEIVLEGAFHYEFSEGDLKRIQDLINEIRDLISASEDLEAKHKRRVLNKLEKLQSEIHKSVSDLDTLYGSVIELSVVARIVGENFKPVVDRIRELMSIVWPTQARAFGLPSNAPFELPGQAED